MLKKNAKRNSYGFTAIELLITVVVIVILVWLLLSTRSGIQQKDRDNVRRQDINDIYSMLESYQARTGQYPTLANLNDAQFIKNNFQGFNANELKDPSGKSEKLVNSPQPSAYAYQPTPVGCNNTDSNLCTGYTLTATLESAGASGTYVKQALY
ncbi:MAG TPA: prepilin-type N-terminal cleavage/methylation domain-containing protein [Candidatus Saccharimonadales bacterium]|nr:prepilin-type N-terminal cleavage/methylation domain-containing protein [Candidatus Saccharimonadales bacterium]